MVESKTTTSPKFTEQKKPKEAEQKTLMVSETEKSKSKMESIDEESPLQKKTSTNVVAEEKRSRRKSDRVDSVIKINYSRESQRDPPKIKDESKLKKDTSPKAKDVTTPKARDVILKTHDSRES